MKRIWITWTRQRRNDGIASALGARLFTFSYEKYGFLRYPFCVFHTLYILFKERAGLCFVMLPSIFSALLVAVLKGALGFKFIIDLHTLNVYYLLGEGVKRKVYDHLLRFCLSRAELILVTNGYYSMTLGQPQEKTFVLPDRIPEKIGLARSHQKSSAKPSVLAICSYDPDEAYQEVFAASQRMQDVHFFFTGDYRLLDRRGEVRPSNSDVQFTGFLPIEEYESLLCSVNVVVVTTKLEGCLCCGVYEAFAAGIPMVISSTEAMKRHFGQGPIYTENSAGEIERAIRRAIEREDEYIVKVRARAQELKEDWEEKIKKLEIRLQEMGPGTRT